MRYFETIPKLKYGPDKTEVRDISRRTKFLIQLLSDPKLFQPYTVPEGMKPEDVAFYYYGSVNDLWLIFLANNIIDPYEDWHMDSGVFSKYLIEKYTEQSSTTGTEVIDWTQNETISDNILYYYKTLQTGDTIRVSKDTYTHLSGENEDGWMPRRIYEEEHNLNEAKRLIQIIDKKYKNEISAQLSKLMAS